MKLENIFEPVQNDLPQVTDTLMTVADVDFPQLSEIIKHVMSSLGKGVRPALVLTAGKFSNYSLEKLVPMAAAAELLHVASLVHDDAIDKSPLRRGLPTLHHLWGDGAATMAGDYLFAGSAELAARPGNLRIVRLFAQTLMALARGELQEGLTVYDPEQNRESYFQRIGGKTAALFSMCTESGAILSDAPEEHIQALKSYGMNLGLAFQVVDDILDFTGDEATMGKPVGNDLLQGIVTMPTILYLEKNPGNDLLAQGFSSKNKAPLRQLVKQIRNSSAIAESYEAAKDLVYKAKTSISPLPENDSKGSLATLADFVLERNK